MTEVYIIRHAEAEGNLYRRIHGWYDSRLTDFGLLQVEKLRERFQDVKFDAVYSSDRCRTRMTADSVLRGSGLQLQENPAFREFGVGVWEDKTWGEVQEFETEQYLLFNRNPEAFHIEGAERFSDIQKRFMDALNKVAAEHDGGRIAIFTHGAGMRIVHAAVLGVPSCRIQEVPHGDNTCVTKLLVEDGRITMEYINDASHLGDLSRTGRQLWWKNGGDRDNRAMWFVPIDITNDINEVSDLWPEASADQIRELLALSERSVVWSLLEGKKSGLIALDIPKAVEEKKGVIAFYGLKPEHRGQMLAVQLLGQAVSVYRAIGRDTLQITIPQKNADSIGFFEHFGFVRQGEAKSVILEKKI